SPAPTAVTGQKRPRRWGASAPAGKCLRISAYSCAITH
ncbi:type IV secretion protein Rhs, partial [Escherichia coli]